MSRVFFTGDTHIPIDISKLNTKNFPEQAELTKDDYLIILGDFGLIWNTIPDKEEEYWTKWLDEKPFTTLWVDGNHEHHIRLSEYPTSEFLGGKVHQISDSIYHLKRGEIFTINDEKFFVMGGANSIDKHRRIEGVSWWKEEIPSKEELAHGYKTIIDSELKVDYILSHCAPYSIESELFPDAQMNDLNSFLNVVHTVVEFKHWYCGHYHIDRKLRDNVTTLYDKIVEI